jgi:DNA invertase Pin-like site-specific DNA recombinase
VKPGPRFGLYARISTHDGRQTCLNQLLECRAYAQARGWTIAAEYVDECSGSKASRPALDRMIADARRRKIDGVLSWSLDRIGRNLKSLVLLAEELSHLKVTLVTLKENLDLGSASGVLMLHLLSALAQFERSRCVERVHAGLERARREGKTLGRPRKTPVTIEVPGNGTIREAALAWGVSRSTAQRWMAEGRIARRPSSDPDKSLPAA